jgi:hypothetical protein
MKPTISRYARVHRVLLEDALLRRHLSNQLVTVTTGNITREFPPEVIQITDTVHDLDMDTGNMTKAHIVNVAFDILIKHVAPNLLIDVRTTPPKPLKPMEKPIVEIIQERMTAIKSKIATMAKQTEELKIELGNCETALASLVPKEPDPEPEKLLKPIVQTKRSQETQEFMEFMLRALRDNPMSVEDLAKARGIKTKHCYSKLFRLKEKGLLEISKNIVSIIGQKKPVNQP